MNNGIRIDGEYDRPLPERTENLTMEEQEELLQNVLVKHRELRWQNRKSSREVIGGDGK